MPRKRGFDAIIIGAGQAGPPLADRLTKACMEVALIERGHFGGTCVNTGCLPSKALIASARVAYLAQRAADYGIALPGPPEIDMAAIGARVETMVRHARAEVETRLRRMPRCTVIQGQARLHGPREVRVGDQILTAERIFLNVGARPAIPPLPGLRRVGALTYATIRTLAVVPRHLVIVGGGFAGLEFAQLFRRFGAEVTVLEREPRVLSSQDEDVALAVRDVLVQEGVRICADVKGLRFASEGRGIAVTVTCRSRARRLRASHVLVATGTRPNTDRLGLDTAHVETDEHGYIMVNDGLETSTPGIWALGECNGRAAFTHTAYNDHEIVAANLIEKANRKVTDRVPCYALFVDPPLARVGLSQEQARAAGYKVLVGRRPMTRVPSATAKDERQGFMEIVVDAVSDQILGATIFGTGGEEAIHAVLDMIAARVPARALRQAVHIHPTVAELLPMLVSEAR